MSSLLHNELVKIASKNATGIGTLRSIKGDQCVVVLSDGKLVRGVLQQGVMIDPGAGVTVIFGNPNIVVPSGIPNTSGKKVFV